MNKQEEFHPLLSGCAGHECEARVKMAFMGTPEESSGSYYRHVLMYRKDVAPSSENHTKLEVRGLVSS